MAAINTNTVTNSNVYLADKSLLGAVKEIKFPPLKWEMKDQEALGMVGRIKLPVGIAAMEGDITFNSFYPEAMKIIAKPKKFIRIMAMSSLEIYGADGLEDELKMVVTMKGWFPEYATGGGKQQEMLDWPTKIAVYGFEHKIGAEMIARYDAMTNTYEVAGEDVLAKYRANTGG
jgi:P2 family phage contractile tail tube protein